jgi:DNA-binding response OmpR family regulator
MEAKAKRTVLVVEDDDTLQAALEYNLTRAGYEVLQATHGEMALEMARQRCPSVVILDVMLPTLDGLEVCRIIRQEMTTPILILTARGQEIDKVSGLELGADDYMTKPFSIRELLARVRALIRRTDMDTAPRGQMKVLSIGGLTINLEARTAQIDGKPVELKPKEYDLLVFMAGHPGRAYNRNQLLDQVWGLNYFGDSRTVDVHIRWLREKIETEPGSPRRIITVRGTGYRFEG